MQHMDKALKNAPPPLGDAARNWMEYQESALSLIPITTEGAAMIAESGRDYRNNLRGHVEELISSNYAVLHGHSLVGFWGSVECFIEDVFVGMILHDQSLLLGEKLAELYGKTYDSDLDEEDNARRLYARVVQKSSGKSASDKFEFILDYVGLSGSLTETVRNSLHEANQIRNLWAHKKGIADKKFVESCPDLPYNLNQRVDLNLSRFLWYANGLQMYASILLRRHSNSMGDVVLYDAPGYKGTLQELFGT
jgi:hypothetical protein